jgi:hypothetical protein
VFLPAQQAKTPSLKFRQNPKCNLILVYPDSIKIVEAYLQQQIKIKQAAKRLAFYTIEGSRLSAIDNPQEHLQLKKLESELENFVESYIEKNNPDVNNLTSSESLKTLMFHRLSQTCENYYNLSINEASKQDIRQAQKQAEEAKRDFDNINCFI